MVFIHGFVRLLATFSENETRQRSGSAFDSSFSLLFSIDIDEALL